MRAEIAQWLVEPTDRPVTGALRRLADVPDVRHVAVMPDVHLAHEVCVGVATATTSTILPEAVGGDIGCGIAVARLDVEAELLREREAARRVLLGLGERIPQTKHAFKRAPQIALLEEPMSCAPLDKLKRRSARVQLGTVGRGNHFVELQSDEQDQLWAMVHSGSRSMGPAIRDHHLARATRTGALRGLAPDSEDGLAYLADHAWALRYAESNRALLLEAVRETLEDAFGSCNVLSSFDVHHNAVRHEDHFGERLWVHRKGVISAREGELGVVAGSMGAPSYHVVGRGMSRALCCCSHGAGRRFTRTEARKRFTERDLVEQMHGVWFDDRASARLLDEAPLAYKDIGKVMRAQNDLVRITRTVTPILSFKGT